MSAQPQYAKISLITASNMAIANMVGTGVFTSLGFQVVDIQSVFALIMLWVVGGIISLCGALSYGELGTALPRSGGEYHLLTKVYHPVMGFLSGWVSATVGFAAPTAIAAVALAKYAQAVFPALPTNHLAAAVVMLFSILHALSIRWGSFFQNFFTFIKVLVIVVFALSGFFVQSPQSVSILPVWSDWGVVASAPFAVSLVYVSYAYTGWNASIYIVGELKNPSRNLPIALFASTFLVMVLYAILNFVFLYAVPMSELAGKVEIGFLAANNIYGQLTADFLSIMIAVLMLSTVSAMVFIGARITQVMGEDYPMLAIFAKKSPEGIPVNSLVFQTLVTLAFIYTSSFDQVMVYAGFTLMLLTSVTVAGVYVLRVKQPHLPRPYKTWGYPVTPALFLAANTWIMVYVFQDKTFESLVGFGIIGVGLLVYGANHWWEKR